MENGMYLLSAQARDLINEAVSALPNAAQREKWLRWSERYPRQLLPSGPARDDEPAMPSEIAVVVLTALREYETAQRNRRRSEPELSEDDMADLDNEISYIGAITRLIQESARA
jgi:hypothetical protein